MTPVNVMLLWHMHQPSYRDPLDGTVGMPWVRLHALKDYLGMLDVLSDTPDVHVTFNLVPSLVDQIDAYARGVAREPLLELSLKPAESLNEFERLTLLKALFMAHTQNLIGRSRRYVELLELRGPSNAEADLQIALGRFSTQDLRDLQVLSKLAWCHLDWQERDPELLRLVGKGRDFDEADKLVLAACEKQRLQAVLPAYRAAQERGQVELSTSPYYHPILPLLCDTDAHHEAHPGAFVPRPYRHPEDAADQIQRALARHAEVFGQTPRGMWPSEGSVSEAAVQELARAGVRWTASDEGVLERSVGRALHRDSAGTAYPLELLYRPWRRQTASGDIALFFRDRALSDLIGFSYSGIDPHVAAQDLLDRLQRVGEQWQRGQLEGEPLVSIILDGENAWEYFPDGGRGFLRTLYRGLQEHQGLRAVTASEALAARPPETLARVFAGSWIRADFSVWIGHADDRRAWDFLVDARDALHARTGHVASDALELAWEAFRAASGSDWCWWYGEDHQSENDFEFDRLFRRHLQAVYRHLGLPAPEALSETLITTRRVETRQSRPTGRVVPHLDGEITTADEWLGAGVYRVPLLGATMHRSDPAAVRALHFGVGRECLAVLIETTESGADFLVRHQLAIAFPGPTDLRFRIRADDRGCEVVREERQGMGWWVTAGTRARAAAATVIEVSIPLDELRPAPEQKLDFRVIVLRDKTELERHPDTAPVSLLLEEISRD
jgi:alpha-amylase/alpha-mannosidase (GH57 family)